MAAPRRPPPHQSGGRTNPVRLQTKLDLPGGDLLDRHAEVLGQLGIARIDNGEELLGRHRQRACEALPRPLIKTALLKPGGDLEGGQRRRAGEAQQRVTLILLRQLEQRGAEADSSASARAIGQP